MDCKNAGGVDVLEEDQICEEGIDGTIEFAKKVAVRFGSVIVITGPMDVITDGDRVAIIKNGHPMMTRITGTGCMTGCLIGTYCGANSKNIFDSCVTSLVVMGLSGEIAHDRVVKNGEGTASFRRHLIDSISLMTVETLKEGAKFEIL
jgi:hydroxyethylthiazole kinase